jgi:PAS domain S-box-containing protein
MMTAPTPTSDAPRTPSRLLAGWRALKSIPAARRTVSGKLILVILLTTAIALSVAGAGLLISDLRDNRDQRTRDLQTEADIAAMAIAPALAFNDQKAAERNLNALQARPALDAAALYRADGSVYASFARDPANPAASRLPAFERRIATRGETLEVFKPIVQNGETLGTLYLRAHYDVTARVLGFLRILGLVLLLSLVAAVFAAGWLQSVITTPLSAIQSVARRLIAGRDHEIRMPEGPDDEFGAVVRALNKMLDEIQSRTQALESANDALKREVNGRLIIERALRDNERLYRAIGESIDYGVWICNAQGRNTYVSDSFLRLVGATQEECSARGWGAYLHPDDRAEIMIAWQECVQNGAVWYCEHRVKGVDGQYHPILAQGVPIRDEAGNITSWAGINLDIGRMKQTEQALREADRRKDEFLATLAHELRNPLAPLRNCLHILRATEGDDAQLHKLHGMMERQVSHMVRLVDDLMEVSRITRGEIELRRQRVTLRDVLEGAIETSRPLLEQANHHFHVEATPEALPLEADPMRLAQVFTNLLNNAAKYTPAGGNITLQATRDGNVVEVRVHDDGIGLAPEMLTQVFDMFTQSEHGRAHSQGGLGIGLTLVKSLVEQHGGTVEARSAGLGQGSEFIVRLPLAAGARIEETGDWPVVRHRDAMSILVADDNHESADSMALFLSMRGHDVRTVYDGRAALEAIAERRPDVVLLDLGMPTLDGYETCQQIRAMPDGDKIAVMATTGWGSDADRVRSAACGFDAHLVKPVDPGLLLARLDALH